MMSYSDLVLLVANIDYPHLRFKVGEMGDGFYLQVIFYQSGEQHGRKWYISKWSARSEVIQTAFKAVTTFEEHEAREKFTYRGRAIFGPHFDVDSLVNLVDAKLTDIRTNELYANNNSTEVGSGPDRQEQLRG